MDFFSRSFRELYGAFREMPQGSRILAGVLVVVLLVSLGYLFSQSLPESSRVSLFPGQSFSQATLSSMDAVLCNAGLTGHEVESDTITVPREEKTKYMAALVAADAMPREFGDYLSEAVESDSWWKSMGQSREAIELAKERELSKIIGQIDGIEYAAVQYDSVKSPGLMGGNVYSASVSVRAKGNQPLDKEIVPGITRTVAGWFAGLKPEDVVVVDLKTGHPWRAEDADIAEAGGGSVALRKESEEKYYKAKIEKLFPEIPGLIVETGVELNEYVKRSVVEVRHDPQTTPMQVRRQVESTTREERSREPFPGFDGKMNQPREKIELGQTVRTGQEEIRTEQVDQTNAVSGIQQQTEYPPLTVRKVTATIKIPESYIADTWRKSARIQPETPLTPEQQAGFDAFRSQFFDEVRRSVAIVLPEVDGNADKTELVHVCTYRGAAMQQVEPVKTVARSAAVVWWSANWPTVTLGAVAGFVLLVFWFLMRSFGQDHAVEESPEALVDRRVSELIEQKPHAAADLLRQWVGG